MIQIYEGLASRAPSEHKDVYIFGITPLANQAMAAITSADELLILQDRSILSTSHVSVVQGAPQGLTSLASSDAGKIAVCAGRDGNVILVDTRTHSTIGQFKTGNLCARSDAVTLLLIRSPRQTGSCSSMPRKRRGGRQ